MTLWRVITVVTTTTTLAALVYAYHRLERRYADELSESHRLQLAAQQAAEHAQARAEAADRSKSLFLAQMSHEIRTPLNGVVGLAELLDSDRLDADQREHVHMLRRSADLLLGIVNDVLDVSKIEAGELTLEAIPVDVSELVRAVAGLVRHPVRPLRAGGRHDHPTVRRHRPGPDDLPPPRDPTAGDPPAQAAAQVLVVDDNAVNRIVVCHVLERMGCVPTEVDSGEHALDALATSPFDLVLMDVHMPGMSGLDATRALRARGDRTRVVALSASTFSEDQQRCLDAGMNAFVGKPVSSDSMREALLL